MASHSQSHSETTSDHEEIRKWAESRGGKPSVVRDTEDRRGPGILRIDFPGGAGDDKLEEISWDEFFETFDHNGLAFLYQDTTADGKESRFSRFISRETAAAKDDKPSSAKKSRVEAKKESPVTPAKKPAKAAAPKKDGAQKKQTAGK